MADAPQEPPASSTDDLISSATEALRECWKGERTTMFQRAMLMSMGAILRILSETRKKNDK